MSDANSAIGVARGLSTQHTFSSGAKRSRVMPRYDLIPKTFLQRVAGRFEMGLRYGEHNYKLGLPFDDTFNHILDHLLAYRERRKRYFELLDQGSLPAEYMNLEEWMSAKQTDGDDLAAAAWGLAAIMYLEEVGKLL